MDFKAKRKERFVQKLRALGTYRHRRLCGGRAWVLWRIAGQSNVAEEHEEAVRTA